MEGCSVMIKHWFEWHQIASLTKESLRRKNYALRIRLQGQAVQEQIADSVHGWSLTLTNFQLGEKVYPMLCVNSFQVK